jgi:hypothetical protein
VLVPPPALLPPPAVRFSTSLASGETGPASCTCKMTAFCSQHLRCMLLDHAPAVHVAAAPSFPADAGPCAVLCTVRPPQLTHACLFYCWAFTLQARRAATDVAESPPSLWAGAGVMEHSAALCPSTVRTWSDISSTLQAHWRVLKVLAWHCMPNDMATLEPPLRKVT